MDHARIQRRLVLFLDDALPEEERNDVAQHLAACSSCSAQLKVLAAVWRADGALRRHEAPPYLGTRLLATVRGYESHRHLFADFVYQLVQRALPALALLILVAGVLLGVYLGNAPVASSSQTAAVPSPAQDRERFFSSIFLDSFRDLPPESIGGVYMALATNSEGGAR